ncbi:cardiolipin synthase [Allofustis seminis]|uniref:cardiolipin synthase n=1 Tax=Allofustis seminis TaxID=166939 RepID=UPI00036BA217|nr:cardiolipin synthase [Allofustis seminis]
MSSGLTSIINAFILLNVIFAVITVFRDRKRDITAVWAWLLVLILLPGIGFVIYAFFGRKLSKKEIEQLKAQEQAGLTPYIAEHQELVNNQKERLENESYFTNIQVSQARLFLNMSNVPVSAENHVTLITDGKDKFKRLLEDIRQATDHIHICYYIFKFDMIGSEIIDALRQKAEEGVEVRLLVDPVSGRYLRGRMVQELRTLGIDVAWSFGQRLSILNFRLNYRNHRKIVIIDGKIAYTGGFNVGDEYLGKVKKFGYWRDTHLKIQGNAVPYIQSRFFMDWNASAPQSLLTYDKKYFPTPEKIGDTSLQVISSGPDSDREDIKVGYLNMISSAKEYIMIQTPYFIPDDALMEAIRIAIFSGVKVKLMIPCKPDHPFVYTATLSYVENLVELGAEVYLYENGFIHAKTIVIDDKIVSVGTANFDIRSFKLNFEMNVFMYDEQLAQEQAALFSQDIEKSSQLTLEDINQWSGWYVFKQQFSRLLSPIL